MVRGEKSTSSIEKNKSSLKRQRKRLTQKDIKKYSNTQLDHVIDRIKANELKFTAILVVIILCISSLTCYIAFSSIQKTTSKYEVRSGDLVATYKEKNDSMGDIISFVNTKSLSDEVGLVSEEYEVEIVNSSDQKRNYVISIVDDLDMVELDGCSDRQIDRRYIKYSVDGKNILSLGNSDHIILSSIDANSKVSYSFRVWVSDDFDKALTSHYHGKILVYDASDINN